MAKDTKFKPGQSGNPSGRPKGTAKVEPIRNAVAKEFGSEEEFWGHVASAAKKGDDACLKMIAARMRAPLRAVSPPLCVDLNFDSLQDAMKNIVERTAAGDISTDQAKDLLSSVESVAVATEIAELKQIVAQLQKDLSRAGV